MLCHPLPLWSSLLSEPRAHYPVRLAARDPSSLVSTVSQCRGEGCEGNHAHLAPVGAQQALLLRYPHLQPLLTSEVETAFHVYMASNTLYTTERFNWESLYFSCLNIWIIPEPYSPAEPLWEGTTTLAPCSSPLMTVPLNFLFIKQELHMGNFYSVFSIILAFETVWDKIHFAIGWCMNEKLEMRVPQSWAKEDGWAPPWQVLCIYPYVQKKI